MSSTASEALSPAAGAPKVTYSVNEAVAATGISRPTLYRAMKDGLLNFYQLGRRRLLSPDHLRDFLQRYEKRPAENSTQK